MSDLETLEEHASFGGTTGFYSHDSEACGGPMRFAVYQPPQAKEGPVPVVFFLSGLTCTADNFTTKAGAQRVAAELGLLLVMPDTSPRGAGYPGEDEGWDFGTGAGFYVDATEAPWSARYRMYSYVTEELPALVDAAFPTKGPAHRSVFGHSMGGHGALVLGLREPTKWRSISALSPIVAPTQVPWGHKAFGGYLGEDREAWKAYDATELVAKTQHPAPILIDQGTADGFLDEGLRPWLFEKAVKDTGIDLTLRMQEGYDHSYFFISSFMDDHLEWHAARLY